MIVGVFAATAASVSLVAQIGTATVDWGRGVVSAHGGAPASLRAPGPGVARVTAERKARAAALEKLEASIGKLPLWGGGQVGHLLAERPAAKTRLMTVIAEAPVVVSPRYASDGGVELDLELPLDAVAAALGGSGEEAASAQADDPTPARIVTTPGKHEPGIVPGGRVHFAHSVEEARKTAESAKVVHLGKATARELSKMPTIVVLGAK
jgi:hypothetical protein